MSPPDDYGHVLDIEASLTHLQERSERRAWHVAYGAAGVECHGTCRHGAVLPGCAVTDRG